METEITPSLFISNLITMISKLSDPWGIKTPDSKHIYMNDEARSYTCTPRNFNLEGRRDSEFPTKWAEMADDFIVHDNKARTSYKSSLVIETHYWYGATELSPWLSEKIPVYDDKGECVAILWNARPVIIIDPLILIDNKKPRVISTTPKGNLFTPAENETIFYLLHGLSAKDISRRKNIALKTVSNRIQNIFQKANVHSLRQLEEFCHEQGFSDYLPPNLLKKGLFLIR